LSAIPRCYHLELCETSLDKLFLADDNAKKYRGPAMPPDTEVLYQLAIGLEYIHQMELIHGNIKPENVLIHVDSTGKVTVKWADFGLSKSINQRAKSGATRAFYWLAPEILELLNNEEMDQSEEDVNLKQTEKSDVFAQGLLFGYYILKGRHLFGTPIHRGNNILSNNAVNLKRK
jgi:serine/threonine-protein kinase/endoribonuclease IRE1